jgi:hypothetical protein
MPLRRLLLRGLSCDPVGFAIFAILGGSTFAIFFEFSERIFSRLRRTLTGLGRLCVCYFLLFYDEAVNLSSSSSNNSNSRSRKTASRK